MKNQKMNKRSTGKIRRLTGNSKSGAFSSNDTIKRLDGRTRSAKLINGARSSLTDALGGNLSPQESILVDRAAFLLFRTVSFEQQILSGAEGSESLDSRYLAWSNSLRRSLESLGLKQITKSSSICDLLRSAE